MTRPRNKAEAVTLPSGLVVYANRRDYWLPELCPARAEHDPKPADFNLNQNVPSKTHRQAKHAVCGLWTQWVSRDPAAAASHRSAAQQRAVERKRAYRARARAGT